MSPARTAIGLAVALLAFPAAALAAEPQSFVHGGFTENVPTLADPAQTYTAYLPSTYDEKRKWPVLLIFDPRQRGTFAAKIFREAAEKHGWILVSSNQTRSDGDMKPNIDAINALWPEVRRRFASDPRRIYAAGFSGGGILALLLGGRVPLAGVIDASGRRSAVELKAPAFAHFGTAGLADFNYVEMRELDDAFAKMRAPHRFEPYDGTHSWMPERLAAAGVEWMELLAMRAGLRERDGAMIGEAYARALAAAGARGATKKLDALRDYRWIVETFDGLVDVAAARSALAALEANPEVAKLRAAEQRAFGYEQSMIQRLSRAVAMLEQGPLPIGMLRSELRLADLQAKARSATFEGQAAQRVLESTFVQFSFYLYRDAVESKKFQKAATLLQLANEIKPNLPLVLYNLACAQARAGDAKAAMASLTSAVANGFTDAPKIASDEDLATLRELPEYKHLTSSLPR